MRVITHLGFGTIEMSGVDPLDVLTVVLDEPFLGKKEQRMRWCEVFPFSECGIVRVLNIRGVGIVSTLQFFESLTGADEYQISLKAPPDETHFLFDLSDGTVTSNQPLGLLTEDFISVDIWIDRWSIHRYEMFEDKENALRALGARRANLAGSTGISASVLFSVQTGKLLRFFIAVAPPQGVIYDWPLDPSP